MARTQIPGTAIKDSTIGGIDIQTEVLQPLVRNDGTVPFVAAVSGVMPTDPAHLATKEYVDASSSTTMFVLLDATAANVSYILPSALSVDGMIYTIKVISASKYYATINMFAGDSIEGETSIALYDQEALQLRSYNSIWYVI